MLKPLIRRLRMQPLVNRPLTSALRLACRPFGPTPEWICQHLPRVGLVHAKLPNQRQMVLNSSGDDFVSTRVYWRGWQGYEGETAIWFWKYAETARVVLDIGAHVGYFAVLAGHANPESRVYAFEPMATPFARLQRHVILNGLTNVTPVPSAVGRTSGEATIYSSGDNSVAEPDASCSWENTRGRPHLQELQVPITSVDDMVAAYKLPTVDLVKIDTETTEPDVLAGMRATVARHHPTIVLEVKEDSDLPPLRQFVADFGYRMYVLTGGGPSPRTELTPDPAWRNYLLTTKPLPPS